MSKEIITKEYFNEIMENVKNTCKYQEGLNDYFSKNGVDGYIYQPDCVDTTMKLLHNIFGEKDIDEWISYFCFELCLQYFQLKHNLKKLLLLIEVIFSALQPL